MERGYRGNKSLNQGMPQRLIMLCAGSMLMGIGVALASVSSYNADAVAFLWEGMHHRFQISLGGANLIFSLVLFLGVVLLDYHQIGIGTILTSIIQGVSLDISLLVLKVIENELLQVVAMILGIVLIALGTAMYACADIGKGTYIGFVIALHNRYHRSLTVLRTMLDASCFLLALVLGAKFAIGPLVSVLCMGYLTEFFTIQIEKQVLPPKLLL